MGATTRAAPARMRVTAMGVFIEIAECPAPSDDVQRRIPLEAVRRWTARAVTPLVDLLLNASVFRHLNRQFGPESFRFRATAPDEGKRRAVWGGGSEFYQRPVAG